MIPASFLKLISLTKDSFLTLGSYFIWCHLHPSLTSSSYLTCVCCYSLLQVFFLCLSTGFTCCFLVFFLVLVYTFICYSTLVQPCTVQSIFFALFVKEKFLSINYLSCFVTIPFQLVKKEEHRLSRSCVCNTYVIYIFSLAQIRCMNT